MNIWENKNQQAHGHGNGYVLQELKISNSPGNNVFLTLRISINFSLKIIVMGTER